MKETTKMQDAIIRAVKQAIDEVGVDTLKRTSLFMSAARASEVKKIAA